MITSFRMDTIQSNINFYATVFTNYISLFITMHIQVPLVINLYLRVLPLFYFFFSLTPFSIWEWIRCFGISYVPAQYTSISAAKLPWIITSLSLSIKHAYIKVEWGGRKDYRRKVISDLLNKKIIRFWRSNCKRWIKWKE